LLYLYHRHLFLVKQDELWANAHQWYPRSRVSEIATLILSMSLNFIKALRNDRWYNKRVLIWRFTLVLIKINSGQIGDQTGLVKKRFPWYGIPIWSLWPNIRSLPSIVAEKNVTKNVHICSWEAYLDPSDSYFLFTDLVGFYTHWTYMHIFRYIFLSNYWWQRSENATKNVHIQMYVKCV
jgi:hypothetical protein